MPSPRLSSSPLSVPLHFPCGKAVGLFPSLGTAVSLSIRERRNYCSEFFFRFQNLSYDYCLSFFHE